MRSMISTVRKSDSQERIPVARRAGILARCLVALVLGISSLTVSSLHAQFSEPELIFY